MVEPGREYVVVIAPAMTMISVYEWGIWNDETGGTVLMTTGHENERGRMKGVYDGNAGQRMTDLEIVFEMTRIYDLRYEFLMNDDVLHRMKGDEMTAV